MQLPTLPALDMRALEAATDNLIAVQKAVQRMQQGPQAEQWSKGSPAVVRMHCALNSLRDAAATCQHHSVSDRWQETWLHHVQGIASDKVNNQFANSGACGLAQFTLGSLVQSRTFIFRDCSCLNCARGGHLNPKSV